MVLTIDVALLVLAMMLNADPAGAGQGPGSRVRSDDAVLVKVIGQAHERSTTFRRLVDAVLDTDGRRVRRARAM